MVNESLPDPIARGVIGVPKTTPAGDDPFPALTDEEQNTFRQIKRAFKSGQLALMRVSHDGKPRAVLAIIDQDGQDTVDVFPVAMLIDDDLFAQVSTPPGAAVIANG